MNRNALGISHKIFIWVFASLVSSKQHDIVMNFPIFLAIHYDSEVINMFFRFPLVLEVGNHINAN